MVTHLVVISAVTVWVGSGEAVVYNPDTNKVGA